MNIKLKKIIQIISKMDAIPYQQFGIPLDH